MIDDELPPEITRAGQKRFAEKPQPDDDDCFDNADRIADHDDAVVWRVHKVKKAAAKRRQVLFNAITVESKKPLDGTVVQEIGRHLLELRGDRSPEQVRLGHAWAVAQYTLRKRKTGGRVIFVPGNIAGMYAELEALRRPNIAAPAILSNWALRPDEAALVEQYLPFALKLAKQFYQTRETPARKLGTKKSFGERLGRKCHSKHTNKGAKYFGIRLKHQPAWNERGDDDDDK